ncbi:MAG TPA: hypothetical protein VFY36_10800 [Solirubrobacteraceae bacterium]|nr:hypothetical protein [Solirubrobacteraceae bacterium]
MATRTIVTSQPDVSCDVCERRLLRGEQPDVFIAAGRRRTVCELCAPRAANEGWMRESDSQSLKLPPMRARRGRSLIDRLRQVGRPGEPVAGEPLADLPAEPESYLEPQPYDFLDGYERTSAEPAPANGRAEIEHEPLEEYELESREEGYAPSAEIADEHSASLDDAERHEYGSYVEPAVGVFNASEFPRRVAGVARSLGAPTINVRSAEHLDSVVRIVVAWELCWYRYEVDLSEAGAETRIVAQGTELDELAREERVANAVADEAGLLSLR